jgi:hypothetical protein
MSCPYYFDLNTAPSNLVTRRFRVQIQDKEHRVEDLFYPNSVKCTAQLHTQSSSQADSFSLNQELSVLYGIRNFIILRPDVLTVVK